MAQQYYPLETGHIAMENNEIRACRFVAGFDFLLTYFTKMLVFSGKRCCWRDVALLQIPQFNCKYRWAIIGTIRSDELQFCLEYDVFVLFSFSEWKVKAEIGTNFW